MENEKVKQRVSLEEARRIALEVLRNANRDLDEDRRSYAEIFLRVLYGEEE